MLRNPWPMPSQDLTVTCNTLCAPRRSHHWPWPPIAVLPFSCSSQLDNRAARCGSKPFSAIPSEPSRHCRIAISRASRLYIFIRAAVLRSAPRSARCLRSERAPASQPASHRSVPRMGTIPARSIGLRAGTFTLPIASIDRWSQDPHTPLPSTRVS